MNSHPLSSALYLLFCIILNTLIAQSTLAQEKYTGNNFVALKPDYTEADIVNTAACVTPSPRQLSWQRLETTAFVHFGLNTFYNQEWGRGNEDPARFNPARLNTDQWAKVLSEAGFKMLIMTCKHHDGFCLWPSKYTNHNVSASPWRGGKGDLVKEVSESCRKYNLKFGVYLSPWDRHEPSYGNSPEYNKYFLNQLTELLTNYGTVDEVWFDGACGEGPSGKKQEYDWLAYYTLIRKLQPNAVIAVMGPDVRWVGTESGYGRETEWSVVPYELANQDKIAEGSQQSVLKEAFTPPGDMESLDLGSRAKIKNSKTLIWYPSEVDVSIRPGWFWHESENGKVKSPEKLLDIYFSSVGRNSLLLMNIPPDTSGLINEADIRALTVWKNALQSIFERNFAANARVINNDNSININTLTDYNDSTSCDPGREKPYIIEFELESASLFNVLLLQENICTGQRIEHFTFEAWIDGHWKQVAEGTTVGYKRIIRFADVTSKKVRLTIDQSRLEPALAEFGLYRQLPVVAAHPSSASFRKSVDVSLTCNDKDAEIYFTTNGEVPGIYSQKYHKPLSFVETTELSFVAIRNDGTSGFVSRSSYQKANSAITLVSTPDEKYSGGGPLGLVDGKNGSSDFADGCWSGFNGTNLEALIDLGSIKDLHEFGTTFNENTKSWIFRPRHVEFLISGDGKNFEPIYSKSFESAGSDSEQLIHVNFNHDCKARYVKVVAVNCGKIPEWHPGKGEPAWLFNDEITAR